MEKKTGNPVWTVAINAYERLAMVKPTRPNYYDYYDTCRVAMIKAMLAHYQQMDLNALASQMESDMLNNTGGRYDLELRYDIVAGFLNDVKQYHGLVPTNVWVEPVQKPYVLEYNINTLEEARAELAEAERVLDELPSMEWTVRMVSRRQSAEVNVNRLLRKEQDGR